jgi:nicotinate-nucleotide--dimethylbenzimidazole phosphoribosyltransferase
MAETALEFDEIKTLISSMEHPSCSARDSFADMDQISRIKYWLNFAADRQVYDIKRPRLSIYAASHGFAKQDEAQHGYFKDMVSKLLAGDHAVNEVINLASADLRLYDLNMDEPTSDLRKGDAMDDQALLNSLSYGLMTVEPENDLVSIAAIGAGSEQVGRAMCHNFMPFIDSKLKIDLSEFDLDSFFTTLKANSGYEVNAIVGAILATRLAGVPVILEGYAAIASALLLDAINPDTHWHCAIAPSLDEHDTALREYFTAKNWLVLDDPRPYGLKQPSAINGGMQIAALRQMLILDHFYAADKMAS